MSEPGAVLLDDFLLDDRVLRAVRDQHGLADRRQEVVVVEDAREQRLTDEGRNGHVVTQHRIEIRLRWSAREAKAQQRLETVYAFDRIDREESRHEAQELPGQHGAYIGDMRTSSPHADVYARLPDARATPTARRVGSPRSAGEPKCLAQTRPTGILSRLHAPTRSRRDSGRRLSAGRSVRADLCAPSTQRTRLSSDLHARRGERAVWVAYGGVAS